MNTTTRRISSVLGAVAMMAGLLITAGMTAQAQYRDYQYQRNDGYYGNRGYWPKERTRQYAFLLGYHNAYTEGREAAERGYRVDYDDTEGYRNGMNGYLDWMGDRGAYRDYYRKGYEQGFKDGQSGRQRRYDREDVERVLGDSLRNVYGSDYGDDRYRDRDRGRRGNGGYYDRGGRVDRSQIQRIAQENGYRDGMRQGQEDRARRRNYDYNQSNEYRQATRGYRNEFGDVNFYRQVYRDAFKRGYDEAYRRGNNGRTGGWRWPF